MLALSRRQLLALAGQALAGLLAAPGVARARETVRSIHRATRNTLSGAIGAGLRRLLGPPTPYKTYEGARRVTLPAPAVGPGRALEEVLRRHAPASGFRDEAIGLPMLARLLQAANGVTGRGAGGVALRAAPSAGALYAGEVYVVAGDVEGLARGVYYYAPLDGELVALEGEGVGVDAVAEALETPHRAAKAACAVLLTNVFGRYRFRYANRGYRYALIDSGHIGENLRLAAGSAGLGEWGPLRFHDDRLNRLIGVDGIEEAVCALHLIGARGPAAAEPGAPRRLVERHRTGRPRPEGADEVPERYHVATKLVFPAAPEPVAGGTVVRAGSPGGGPTADAGNPGGTTGAPAGGSATTLPERPAPGERVEALIARRRSARRLEPEPIARADLGFVLEAAAGHPALRRAPGVELRVFVHRVEGLAAGLYRAHPAERVLVPLRPGDRSEALAEVCLGQEKARQAAAVFVMVASLEPGTEGAGRRVWRDRCLEAGSMGQRIYLAAEAVGLAARNLAGFFDDRLDRLVGVDGRRRASLHLTVLGRGD